MYDVSASSLRKLDVLLPTELIILSLPCKGLTYETIIFLVLRFIKDQRRIQNNNTKNISMHKALNLGCSLQIGFYAVGSFCLSVI